MDVGPSSTLNPHEKHTFQFASCLMMLEYIGAALCCMGCCMKGATPPPHPPLPPMGGKAPLSTASNIVCKWGVYVAAAGAPKICTSTTSTSTTSTTATTTCWETHKVGDQELGDGWLYHLCRLVWRVALHGECGKLLLHCLLVGCKLVDCRSHCCCCFGCSSCQ